MANVIYIYKGKEISHTRFLSLCRSKGLLSGHSKSHYEHIVDLAFNGNRNAVELLNDLQVINPNYKEFF